VTPSTDQSGLRIGTAERESATTALGEHLAAGRLDVDEYGDRVGSAHAARTFAELDALFIDLPAPHPKPVDVEPTFAAAGRPPFGERRGGYPRWMPASVGVRVAILLIVLAAAPIWLPILVLVGVLYFVVVPMLVQGRVQGRGGYRRRW
jgi:hypothetical protein